jgi:hypothetical protein
MPDNLTVSSIAAVQIGNRPAAEPRAAAIEPQTQAEPFPAPSLITNPTLRLDAALGLVVIEFRNNRGDITTSIPSKRQLEAYQRWDETHLGPPPAGSNEASVRKPAQVAASTPATPGPDGTKPDMTPRA